MKNNPVIKMTVTIFALVAVIAAVVICGIYMNYMEYLEIGESFTSLFWVDFNARLITFVAAFFIFFILIFVNFIVIRNNLLGIDMSFSYLKKNIWFVILSAFIAVILALLSRDSIADTIMPYLNSEHFNKGDPVFYKDIGYYVFRRPFYISVADCLLQFSAFLFVASIALYAVFYGKFDFYNMKSILKEKGVLIHIISLVMIYFTIKALTYKFMKEDILFNHNKNFIGADYVDLKVWLKFYNIAPVILIAIVVIAILFILRQKIKYAAVAVMIYPLTFIITTIIASVVNVMVIDPNEMAVQNEYIQNNINYTRSAYALDKVNEREYDVLNNLDDEKIMQNIDTIDNIRVTDFDQTVNVLNQMQSLKTYYTFTDSDIVTYTLDGVPTAVSIGAREINTDKLDESAHTYVNTKMRYTHGMGVVAHKINSVTENGQPQFIVKDIPVNSVYDELRVKEPRIYYGESKNDYVIVSTKDGETDDIKGNGYAYQGKSGIGMGFFNRLILAVREADFNMLISNQISRNSKILLNTNIMDRVNKIAPFLTYDKDPTIVIDDDGSLKWIIDAYTTTKFYPYAEYYGDINYIRNSVKVVIDAYEGTTQFYIIDKNDPVIKSYARIYPELFESADFPKTLSEHIRYPMDIFTIQSEMLQKYHIKSADEFYQKKGLWAIANEKISENSTHPVKPYYNFMAVEDGKAELVLMIPYTPSNKDNMIAWLAVGCTGENYGQMFINHFSTSENIAGTYQVENMIDSNAEISQDISLWESSGSAVIRGNMLVIPVANNLLYVEPIYITSGNEQSTLPQVARIVMCYNNKVVAEPTLNACIEKLFDVKRPEEGEGNETLDLNDYIQRVIDGYTIVKNSSQSGDWEGFGKAMSELDNSIVNLESIIASQQDAKNEEPIDDEIDN